MAGIFKRAANAIGRWTGLRREESTAADTFIEPVLLETENLPEASSDPVSDAVDQALEAMEAGDDARPVESPWEPAPAVTALGTSETSISADPAQAPEMVLAPIPDQSGQPTGFIAESAAIPAPPMAEEPAPQPEPAPEPRPAPELKPGKPSVTFTQLYELISTEVNKRNDSSIAVYERLLATTREELESTRRGSRVAWSVGGVMTAVAAFGGVWAATEVGATRSELSAIKHHVTGIQQINLERDKLHAESIRIREAGAKVEIDSLKARLDQALAATAERDRLRGELETVTRAKLTMEQELRLARAIATTQPVSDARKAAETYAGDKGAVGSERQDVWSVLLNGRD